MVIKGIRTFLPSKDFLKSRQFYLDLKFNLLWESKNLLIFGDEKYNFFLQDYYNEEWANNMMIQLHVVDLDEMYNVAYKLVDLYDDVRIKPIFNAEYGRTFHLIGPAGELWHITEYK